MSTSRRRLLQLLGGTAVAAPFAQLLGVPQAWGLSGRCERVIFFYFPDGVAGASQDGQPSAWHPSGSEFNFNLSDHLGELRDLRDECLFFRGLSMGPTDSGSHPGGAKKLLTAADHGNGESIDQFLSRTAGGAAPWRHLYLGAMATQNNASGDKHIVYPSAGASIAPQDDPRRAFEALFAGFTDGGGGGSATPVDPRRASLLDALLGDLGELSARLGPVERSRLDLHLESLREVERRTAPGTTEAVSAGSCDQPWVDTGGFTADQLQDAAAFPEIVRAQIDTMVLAMACGLTRVGTLQCSHHTSELEMSRFAGTELYESDPFRGMRSHQASHYGASHDPSRREYDAFVKQRRWFADQFAYLCRSLAERPEGDGTMLDHSLCVFLTEVADGNTHLHDDLPVVLAGRGGGRVQPGRLLNLGYERHGRLWVSLAHAMDQRIDGFGDASWGPLPGVLA
jgi:hypothetical protein